MYWQKKKIITVEREETSEPDLGMAWMFELSDKELLKSMVNMLRALVVT